MLTKQTNLNWRSRIEDLDYQSDARRVDAVVEQICSGDSAFGFFTFAQQLIGRLRRVGRQTTADTYTTVIETAAQGDFARTESITSSMESSEVTYYAFLTENPTVNNRDVNLELQYNGETISTLTIRQKCPNWMTDGAMGWEYIEEDGEKPFGFAWTRKVTYKSKNWVTDILINYCLMCSAILTV